MQHEDLFPDEFPLEELLRLDDDSDDLTEPELLQLEPVPDEAGDPSEQENLPDDAGQSLSEWETAPEEPEQETPSAGPVYEDIPVSSPRFFGDIPLGPDDDTIEDPEDDDDFELFSGVAGKLSDFRAPRRERDPEPAEPEFEPEPAAQELVSEADEGPEEAPDEEPAYEPLPIASSVEFNPFVSGKPELQEEKYPTEPEPVSEQPIPARRSVFDVPMWDEDTHIEDPEDDDDFELFSGIAGRLSDFHRLPQEPEPAPEETVDSQAGFESEPADKPEEAPEAVPDEEPDDKPLPIVPPEPFTPFVPEKTEMPEDLSGSEAVSEQSAPAGRSVFDIPMWDDEPSAENPENDDDFELFSGITGRLNDFHAPRQHQTEVPAEPEEELQPEQDEPFVPEDESEHEPEDEPEEVPDEEPEYEPIPIAPATPVLPEEPEEKHKSGPEESPTTPARRSVFDIPMWDEDIPAEDSEDDDFELFSGIAGSLSDFHAPHQPESEMPAEPEPAPEEPGVSDEESGNEPFGEPEERSEFEPIPMTPSVPEIPDISEPEENAEESENAVESQPEEETDEEDSGEEENEAEPEDEGHEVKQSHMLGWFFRKKPGQKAESIVVEEAEEPEETTPEVPVPPDFKVPVPVIIHSVPLDEEPEDDGSPISLMPAVEGSISDFIPPKTEELIDFSEENPAKEENPEESAEAQESSEEPDEESADASEEESTDKEEPDEDSDESEDNEESNEESDEDEDDGSDSEDEDEEGEQKKHVGLFARLKKGRQQLFGNESDDEDESGTGDESEEESEEEEQGFLQKAPLADIPPRQLASIFGAGLRLMRVRVIVALILCLPLIYLNLADSLNLPIYLVMWDDSFACLTMLELLAIILVLNFDTLISGLLDPFRGKASIACIPVYAAIFTMADCAVFALIGREGPFPCAGAAGLAVAMTGLGHYYHRVGDRSSCRAAATSSTPERISRQKEDGEITEVLLKCGGGPRQFGSQIQESDGIRELIGAVGLIILLAGIALAGVSILNGGNTMSFFWFASVILTAASPLAATLAYGMPYRRISARLAQGGAAIAGWKGVLELSTAKEIVLNDSDFFPSGMVKCTTIRTRGEIPSEEILGYAATLIHMGGCGVDSTFAEQVYSRGAKYHFEELTDFCIYEDGGYGGRFGDKEVAVGTAELMESLEIPFSRKQASRTALFCAVNGELAAIFNLTYTLPAYVLSSMKEMERAKLKGILATRDFNLSPENLKKVYGIPLNKLRIAEIDERIDLTPDDSPAGTDLGALLCREGIDTHVDTVIGAKRLYRSARKSARWLSASSVVGMALGAYLTIMHAYTALEPINLLIFLVLWSLPPIIQGTQADKY